MRWQPSKLSMGKLQPRFAHSHWSASMAKFAWMSAQKARGLGSSLQGESSGVVHAASNSPAESVIQAELDGRPRCRDNEGTSASVSSMAAMIVRRLARENERSRMIARARVRRVSHVDDSDAAMNSHAVRFAGWVRGCTDGSSTQFEFVDPAGRDVADSGCSTARSLDVGSAHEWFEP